MYTICLDGFNSFNSFNAHMVCSSIACDSIFLHNHLMADTFKEKTHIFCVWAIILRATLFLSTSKAKDLKEDKKIFENILSYVDSIYSVFISLCLSCVLQVVETDRIIGNKTVDVSCGLVSDCGFEH